MPTNSSGLARAAPSYCAILLQLCKQDVSPLARWKHSDERREPGWRIPSGAAAQRASRNLGPVCSQTSKWSCVADLGVGPLQEPVWLDTSAPGGVQSRGRDQGRRQRTFSARSTWNSDIDCLCPARAGNHWARRPRGRGCIIRWSALALPSGAFNFPQDRTKSRSRSAKPAYRSEEHTSELQSRLHLV